MSRKTFKVAISVHLLLLRNHEILLMRRINTGYGDGLYSLVAGHLEVGETVSQAVIREAFEEVGITLHPQNVSIVHVMHHRSGETRLSLFFRAGNWEGEPANMEPEKCDDLQWFPQAALPENMVPYVKRALEQSQNGELFSEFGWDDPPLKQISLRQIKEIFKYIVIRLKSNINDQSR